MLLGAAQPEFVIAGSSTDRMPSWFVPVSEWLCIQKNICPAQSVLNVSVPLNVIIAQKRGGHMLWGMSHETLTMGYRHTSVHEINSIYFDLFLWELWVVGGWSESSPPTVPAPDAIVGPAQETIQMSDTQISSESCQSLSNLKSMTVTPLTVCFCVKCLSGLCHKWPCSLLDCLSILLLWVS